MRVAAEIDTNLTKQVAEVLKDADKIKAGMKREDLMKVFTTEGGISTVAHRTFVHQRCPIIKVDVVFTLAEKQDALDERPSDKILKISSPYLAWSIID